MSSPPNQPPRTVVTSLADRRRAADAGAMPPIVDDEEAARQRRARIAPHAMRHAQQVRRTWTALLFFPIFAVYVLVDVFRDAQDLSRRLRQLEVEARPPFRRPAGMPPIAERTMPDIVDALEAFPFEPLPLPTQVAFFRDFGPDATGALFSPNPQLSTFLHRYPLPFQQRLFTGEGGHQVVGMQAMHEQPGPAVVICHGLLMHKNFDAIIQLARRAYEEWGFHVVTLDLRGWGQSTWTTDAPASGGYHEGLDVVEVARELHRLDNVTSVATVGFSLGGASVLKAAHVSSISDDRPIDGGTIAVSAPTRIDLALEHISTRPHWRSPFFGLWHMFRAIIKANVRRRGLEGELRTWRDIVEALSCPYYGVTMEEFCERASATGFVQEVDQPVLELHAMDDFLVPVEHAELLREAAEGNPWVHVMVRESGNHCSFAAVDSRWYHSVLRRWLEYWAMPIDAGAGADTGPEDDVALIGG